jgi:hypothetical protein
MDDARDYRSKLDKMAEGLVETGNSAVKTCEQGINQKPIIQVLNER